MPVYETQYKIHCDLRRLKPRIHGKHLFSNKVESTCCGVAVNMFLATLRVAECVLLI